MKNATRLTATALFLLSAALFADTERNTREEKRADREVRTVKTVKAHREDARKPGTATRVPPKAKTVKQPGRQPAYHDIKPKPSSVYRPPVTVHTAKKTKVYRRPPHPRPLPYHHRPGYTVRTLPYAALTLTFGGLFFYYTDGIYYRHDRNRYVVTVPPVGLYVPTLPPAHSVVILGGRTYYTYAEVYYVWDGPRSAYRVVESPSGTETYLPGDIVDTLPDNAYSVTIEGKQYFRYGDTYFLQTVQNERIVYVVVTP